MAPLSQSHIWIARQPFVYWEKSPDECLKLDNLFSKNKFLTSDFSVWSIKDGSYQAIGFFRCLLCGMKNMFRQLQKGRRFREMQTKIL